MEVYVYFMSLVIAERAFPRAYANAHFTMLPRDSIKSKSD